MFRFISFCVALCLLAGFGADAGVTYSLGAPDELLDAAFYAGEAADGSDVAGRQAFWGRGSHDGKTVAFYAVNNNTLQLAVFLVDVGNPASWRRLTVDVAATPSGPIYWTPDDLHLLAGPYRVPVATGAFEYFLVHGYRFNDSSVTQLPANNWAIAYAPSGTHHADLVALPIWRDGQADPNRAPVILTNIYAGGARPDFPHIAPDGSKIAFANYVGSAPGSSDFGDIYVLDNVPDLMASVGPDTRSLLAPDSLSAGNIIPIHTTQSDNYTHVPTFSQDLSLVFFTEDMNNVFCNNDFFNTVAVADFDVVIANADGSGEVRLGGTGNQILSSVTPGGTRFIYMADVAGKIHLYMTALETATEVSGTPQGQPEDNAILTTSPQETSDASGTVVSVPSGVVVDFPDGAPQEIQINTPAELNVTALAPGVQGVPVFRDFGPDGTTFDTPITITISYTDAEVEGFDEAELKVYLYNSGTSLYDTEVTTITDRDLVNNTISFTVAHFSKFTLGAELDTDGDGIPDVDDRDDDNDGNVDFFDAFPLDTDDDGVDNADDPDDDDDGIPDGDDAYPFDTDNDPLNNFLYHSLGQFSDVQGQDCWHYAYYNYATSEYLDMSWSESEQRWESPDGAWIDKQVMKSTTTHAAVRGWRVPADGTIRISSIYYLGVACYGGDYTLSSILLRKYGEMTDTALWGPHTTTGETEQDNISFDATAEVEVGDWILFRVESGDADDECDARTFLPRIQFTPEAEGTTYVDFDDGYSGSLTTVGTLTGGGYASIGNGEAVITCLPQAGWAGAHMGYGEMSLMHGDFTAQVLLPDPMLPAIMGFFPSVLSCGIALEVAGTVENDGDGSLQYAFCGPVRNVYVPSTNQPQMAQIGLGAEYTLAGEALPMEGPVGVRVVRNGGTLELWAAYGADAPVQGDPETGNFHLVNSQTISGPVTGIYLYAYGTSGAQVQFDDFYLSGEGIMNYASPEAGPDAPDDVHVENDAGLVGSASMLGNPVWSHDGKKVAFFGQPDYAAPRGICVYDLVMQETTVLVSEGDDVFNISPTGMAWSPDDQRLYFTSMLRDLHFMMLNKCNTSTPNQTIAEGQVEVAMTTTDVIPGLGGHIYNPCVVQTEEGYKLLFCTELWDIMYPEDYDYVGLLYRDIDEAGEFTSSECHRVMHWEAYAAIFSGLSVSPSGNNFVMAIADGDYGSSQNTVFLVTDLLDILLGVDPPVENFLDARVRVVDNDSHYKTWPRFTQDGTRILYSKDFSGRFFQYGMDLRGEWHGFGNSFECDFDIMSTTVEDVTMSNPATRIPKWANQLRVQPSEGGTRLVWVDDSFNYMFASTMRFSAALNLSGGIVTDELRLSDGCGTLLVVEPGITVTGIDPGATSVEISVFTPFSPLEEALMDVGGVPVVRQFGPSGLTFNPPAYMGVFYGDGEIRGMDELTLQVVHINESGDPEILQIMAHDTVNNTFMVPVPGFSQFGVGGNFVPGYDGDNDGLEDQWETMDLDPDAPGVQNPFNPYVDDSTGDNFSDEPDGISDAQNDYDGDGINNGTEFGNGSNPMDPDSAPPVPVAAWPVAGAVLAAALIALRRRNR